jgi:DNA-directed RNA polymerase subunit L
MELDEETLSYLNMIDRAINKFDFVIVNKLRKALKQSELTKEDAREVLMEALQNLGEDCDDIMNTESVAFRKDLKGIFWTKDGEPHCGLEYIFKCTYI